MRSRGVSGAGRLLMVVLVAWAVGAAAQTPQGGMIIRVADPPLLFIDLGTRDGVKEGDLYDIVQSEVVSHPLSGDTLAISPRTVGTLRVRQVYEKVSLAEVVALDKGTDPMLLKVTRIQDPDRLAQVEELARAAHPVNLGPSVGMGLVPGLYQLRTGHAVRGPAFVAVEGAAVVFGVAYRISSNDWKRRYDGYRADDQGRYDTDYLVTLGKGMQDRRRWSNRLFWGAGALYALNWIDVLWSGGQAAPSLPVTLGPGVDGNGHTLVQAAWSF